MLNVKVQQEAGNVLCRVKKFSRVRHVIAIRENSGRHPYYGPEILLSFFVLFCSKVRAVFLTKCLKLYDCV